MLQGMGPGGVREGVLQGMGRGMGLSIRNGTMFFQPVGFWSQGILGSLGFTTDQQALGSLR